MRRSSNPQPARRRTPRDLVRLIRRHWVIRNGIGHVAQIRADGIHLGNQVKWFRHLYALGMLRPELARRLESLPNWSWSPSQDKARGYLAALRAHIQEHGWFGAPLPPRLRAWLQEARRKYNRGIAVSASLVRDLERIPGFSWAQSVALGVEHRLARLARKHLDIIRTFGRRISGGRIGGAKVESSLYFFRRHEHDPRIPADVKAAVAAIPGWSWDPLHDVRVAHIRVLRALARKHGGLPEITSKTVIDGHRIGVWVSHCCLQHRRGRLSKELVRELESIPGWTWRGSVDDRHRRNLRALKQFLQSHELSEVHTVRNYRGANLRDWVTARRVHYREGRTQPEWLIRELEMIPGWSWNPRQEAPLIKRRPRRRSTQT